MKTVNQLLPHIRGGKHIFRSLEHIADHLGSAVNGHSLRIFPCQRMSPAGAGKEAHDQAAEGRFAGPVLPGQRTQSPGSIFASISRAASRPPGYANVSESIWSAGETADSRAPSAWVTAAGREHAGICTSARDTDAGREPAGFDASARDTDAGREPARIGISAWGSAECGEVAAGTGLSPAATPAASPAGRGKKPSRTSRFPRWCGGSGGPSSTTAPPSRTMTRPAARAHRQSGRTR